jgi:hypothetical protein
MECRFEFAFAPTKEAHRQMIFKFSNFDLKVRAARGRRQSWGISKKNNLLVALLWCGRWVLGVDLLLRAAPWGASECTDPTTIPLQFSLPYGIGID